MDYVFAFANTASLKKQMKPRTINDAKIGDVFIQGGSPGHAIIVVDSAVNELTGDRVFMLAQSYMPAQETQILINPKSDSLSPWFQCREGELQTPEWTFNSSDLKHF